MEVRRLPRSTRPAPPAALRAPGTPGGRARAHVPGQEGAEPPLRWREKKRAERYPPPSPPLVARRRPRPRTRSRARAMPAPGSQLQRPPSPSPPAAQKPGAEPQPPPHGELQYLGQIEHILRCGVRKDDRTGTGTLSVFGMQARYSLRGDPRAPGARERAPEGAPIGRRGRGAGAPGIARD